MFYLFSFCHDESSQGTETPWLQLFKSKQNKKKNFTNASFPVFSKAADPSPSLIATEAWAYLLSREPTVVAIAAGTTFFLPFFLYCVYLALFSPLFSYLKSVWVSPAATLYEGHHLSYTLFCPCLIYVYASIVIRN